MEGSAIRATGGGVCDGQGGSEHKGERGGSLTRAGQGDAWPLNEAARAPPRNVPRLLLLLAHEAGRTLASAAPSGTRTRARLWWPERGRVSGGQAGARAPRVGPSAPSSDLPSSRPPVLVNKHEEGWKAGKLSLLSRSRAGVASTTGNAPSSSRRRPKVPCLTGRADPPTERAHSLPDLT
jgi:hypothetical protein